MSLTKRGDRYGADLREYGAGRLSLFTSDKDLARWLHNELEQMALAGKPVTGDTVKALTVARRNAAVVPAGVVVPHLSTQPFVAPAETGRKTSTMREAFRDAMINRPAWRDSTVPHAIEGPYRALSKHFGDARMLHTITARDIYEYQQKLIAEKLSGGTINRRIAVLSVMFNETEKQFVITGDPCYDVKMPTHWSQPYQVEDPCVLTREQEATVCAWFAASHRSKLREMADLSVALVDTGFRISEMRRVEHPRDIDFERKMICARSTRAARTKTGKTRWVEMTPRVYEIMDRRCREQQMVKPFGGVNSPQQYWELMRQACGFKPIPHFTIHALRHTCATRLAEQGVPDFKIMMWMGHSQISTTQIYVNLAANALRGVSKALEQECDSPAPAQKSMPEKAQ